ncbi:MAG: PQQ-dependent sugar dehydrogenase [Burkholderiales bacterium]|nr:PQQ-dependent sugar dehydrogenase [Burkholderiales bacterium]
MSRSKAILVSAAIGWAVASAPASALDVKLEVVASGLTHPMAMVSPPGDDRKFIVEQTGTVKILGADGKMIDGDFLNIKHKLPPLKWEFDEEGLLGIAFPPDFKKSGKFYISYTGQLRGDADLGKQLWYAHTNYVTEMRVSKDDPNKADPNYERIVLAIDWPQFNHNGMWIAFGPDGMLYVSTGDGGYANDWGIGHNVTIGNGQDTAVLLGKMLRIDPSKGDPYDVPKDNPFVGKSTHAPEIWALGLRNPWRCSFDMGGSKQLFCGDVGQNSYEEISLVSKGGNYGWRAMEGSYCFDYVNPNNHPKTCNKTGMTDPIIEYKNCSNPDFAAKGDCEGISITGGYVYRGPHKAWDGVYFFGDWSKSFMVAEGVLFAARKQGDNWVKETINVTNIPGFNDFIMAFGQDNQGNVYVMGTRIRGPNGEQDKIYKIVP